jgi:hypothetical protein
MNPLARRFGKQPDGQGARMAQHIIVGFDGSPQLEDALVLGRQLATAVRGRLVAAEVTGGSERPPSDVRADREDAEFVSISAPRLPPRFTRGSLNETCSGTLSPS